MSCNCHDHDTEIKIKVASGVTFVEGEYLKSVTIEVNDTPIWKKISTSRYDDGYGMKGYAEELVVDMFRHLVEIVDNGEG